MHFLAAFPCRHLVTNLVKHERIQTTVARAKALKIYADRIITLGKQGIPVAASFGAGDGACTPGLCIGDEAALKKASTLVNEKPVLVKLFTVMADRYKYD